MSHRQIQFLKLHGANSAGTEPKLPRDTETKAKDSRLKPELLAFSLELLPFFQSGTRVAKQEIP